MLERLDGTFNTLIFPEPFPSRVWRPLRSRIPSVIPGIRPISSSLCRRNSQLRKQWRRGGNSACRRAPSSASWQAGGDASSFGARMEGTRKRTAIFDTIDTFSKVVKMAEMSKMSASVRAADFSVKKKSITQ